MIHRNQRGERRVSPALYKLLLTAHIAVSGGWLGVVIAKLGLGMAAVTTGDLGVAAARYAAAGVLNLLFPPLAIATIITGVLLSLGTRWGLLQHSWVVTKIVLTVGVIISAVQLGDRLVEQAIVALPGPVPADGIVPDLVSAPTLLIAITTVHLVMLGAATIISVYKPWGRTWFARRKLDATSRTEVVARARELGLLA